jgi:arylformamidase
MYRRFSSRRFATAFLFAAFWQSTVSPFSPSITAADAQNSSGAAGGLSGSDQSGSGREAIINRFRQARAARLRNQTNSESSNNQSAASSTTDGSFVRRSNVAYGNAPLEKLDIYLPKNAKPNLPILFFVHGGGWSIGDKAQKDHAEKGKVYTDNGIIFISVNYGLAPQVTYPKLMQDVADSFAYVHTHAKEFGGDPSRIYVMGHSAGAQLVDLLGTNDRFLSSKGLSLANISGVISLDTASLDLAKRKNDDSFEGKMVGDMIDKAFGSDPKVLADASPFDSIQSGKKYPPFLMYCGAKRPTCIEQHNQFSNAMQKVGGQVTVNKVNLSHRDINLQAGEQNSEIFKSVIKMINGS